MVGESWTKGLSLRMGKELQYYLEILQWHHKLLHDFVRFLPKSSTVRQQTEH